MTELQADAMNPRRNSPPAAAQGGKLVLATIAVALATFMNVLDSSIANVAIPTISGNLGVSVDEGTWVITVFAAANAISIPLTGWLTQRIGQIKLFVGAILLFVLASWLCGIAPTLPILLARARVAGRRRRAADSAVAGDSARLVSEGKELDGALAVGDDGDRRADRGPALGGWITDSYSWSWIFYINIPVGLFAAGVTWVIYRDRESPTRKLPIDKVGLLLADRVGRLAADHARQGQGSRLVQLAGDRACSASSRSSASRSSWSGS